jgi:hypothetical protein
MCKSELVLCFVGLGKSNYPVRCKDYNKLYALNLLRSPWEHITVREIAFTYRYCCKEIIAEALSYKIDDMDIDSINEHFGSTCTGVVTGKAIDGVETIYAMVNRNMISTQTCTRLRAGSSTRTCNGHLCV